MHGNATHKMHGESTANGIVFSSPCFSKFVTNCMDINCWTHSRPSQSKLQDKTLSGPSPRRVKRIITCDHITHGKYKSHT